MFNGSGAGPARKRRLFATGEHAAGTAVPVHSFQQPLFIVGAPRSGTTLLRSILAAGKEVAIPPESHFLAYLYHRYRGRFAGWGPQDTREVIEDVLRDAHFREWQLPAEAVWAEVQKQAPSGYGEAIACVYRAYARREGKERWGDKTPHYVFFLRELSSLFPDMRVIHLLRDGRDVACSHLDLRRRGQAWVAGSAPAAAAWWRASVRAAARAAPELGQRFVEIRYEDLVSRPEETVERLCAAAGISFRPEMVHDRGHVVSSSSNLFSRASQPVAGRARETELTPRQVAEFEAVAGVDLLAHGYALSSGHPAALTAVEARLRAEGFMTWRRTRRWGRQRAHRFLVPVARRRQAARIRRMEAGGEAGL
jgi:sulfotransferase family protein